MRAMEWCILGAVLFGGCNIENHVDPDWDNEKGTERHGCIVVEPQSLVFETQELRDASPEIRLLTIRNQCDSVLESGLLNVLDVYDGQTAGFASETLSTMTLQPGEEALLGVSFLPTRGAEHTGSITIVSDDPNEQEIRVPLTGLGIAPEIQIDADTENFGEHPIGCESENRVVVYNTGNQDLVVDAISFNTANNGEFEIETDGIHFPLVIPPYDPSEGSPIVPLTLTYTPLDTMMDNGFLVASSNDPKQPESIVEFQGTGLPVQENVDRFVQPDQILTDVLFTFDRSCSMGPDVAAALNNFDTFISEVVSHGGDYRVAAITSDDGCVSGGTEWIDNTLDTSDAQRAFEGMIDWDRTYSSSISNTEKGFTLIDNALSDENLSGCNADLLRDRAHLNIIHVSDEPEQSLMTYVDYLTILDDVKNRPDAVTVHAVAPDYPSGCPGNAYPPSGYYEATMATEGEFLSICDLNWGTKLTQLAESAIVTQKSHRLSRLPIPGTIEVDVDGHALNHGWHYDADTNTVVFSEDIVPVANAVITVHYGLPEECEV